MYKRILNIKSGTRIDSVFVIKTGREGFLLPRNVALGLLLSLRPFKSHVRIKR